MITKGVFLDLYGTLLLFGDMKSAWADWLTTMHRHFSEYGLAMSREEMASRCEGFFGRPTPTGRSPLTVFERRLKILACDLGLDLGNPQLRRTAHACVEAWQRYIRLDPEALPVLRCLREHKKLSLVSNYDHPPYLHALLTEQGLARLFDAIVISGEVGVAKPDPAIFWLALRHLGLEPGEVVHVGDSEDDVMGACNADIRPVLIQRDSRSAAENADFHADAAPPVPRDEAWTGHARIIGSLSDLLSML